jgi:hypothetical protein
VVPTLSDGWLWVFGSGRSLASLARQVARMARHLAEGEALPSPREASPWMGVLYVLAGLFGLVLLTSLINLVAESFAR